MKVAKIWLFGGITGALTSMAFFFSHLVLVIDSSFSLLDLGISLLTPAMVAFALHKLFHYGVTTLIIVAYLTVVIPTIPSLFGAPNLGIKVFLTLTVMGLVGGLIWITPFAIWKAFGIRFPWQKDTFPD